MILGLIRLDELHFYPKGYTLNPLPEKNIKRRAKTMNREK
jgi:hypothetical protein